MFPQGFGNMSSETILFLVNLYLFIAPQTINNIYNIFYINKNKHFRLELISDLVIAFISNNWSNPSFPKKKLRNHFFFQIIFS